MNDKPKKDLAASIRQRLSNKAQASGRPFQEVFEYFAMERFLYRLSQSRHAGKFVLKGALMFTAWQAASARSTRDIDFLARMANDQEEIAAVIREISTLELEPDGMRFDAESVRTGVIKEDADYEGVRVTFMAYLQNMKFAMQIDIGFGDVTFPAPQMTDYPTLLDLPAPRLNGYGRETVVAEKFEAMATLGLVNSRMKDYFDLWLLSRQFDFEGPTLKTAIEKTFLNRGTAVLPEPTALTSAFGSDGTKVMQWNAFIRKARLTQAPNDLLDVVQTLGVFLLPIAEALSQNTSFNFDWKAPGPWKAK